LISASTSASFAFAPGIRGAGTGSVAAAEELEVIDHDRMPASFSATVLVFPSIEFQAAFDVELSALLAILIDRFTSFAKGRAFDEANLIALFAAGGLELVVDR
jgi:hypothetical protein